jgi:hypothetical protein
MIDSKSCENVVLEEAVPKLALETVENIHLKGIVTNLLGKLTIYEEIVKDTCVSMNL